MLKLKALSGSIRFWILTMTAVLVILEQLSVGLLDIAIVFRTVEVWLGAVVALGTVDSLATKFGAALK